MKLVEILARELAEWPCDGSATQDPDKEVRFECCSADFYSEILADDAGDDYGMGDEVTREQWQAERDKLIQPQANKVDMKGPFPCAPAGDPLNTIEYDIEFPSGVFSLEAKTDQIDGPIKWRDTINELDAYIEEFTRERAQLVSRLAEEGFLLISPVAVIEHSVDMANWRNWKAGDVIEMVADDWCDLSRDAQYDITSVSEDGFAIVDDCGDKRHMDYDGETVFKDGRVPDFKFIRRP